MLLNILYFLLAGFGLGFLIFIHELGHYFAAKKVGMTVEAFAIGFGKPIFTWERKGVKWQLCCLPFGGYVRIKGMEKKEGIEPYEISDGFFGKSPWDRIKVAVMGPVVNIVFALFAFILIWTFGGRDKPFSEFTKIVGWVDPKSDLYQQGVRPGDEITHYDGHSYQGYKDLMYAAIMGGNEETIHGYEVDYPTQGKVPFAFTAKAYPDPRAADPGIRTFGILSPANYLIYDKFSNGQENPLAEGSPMIDSGIQYKDRILWVDGNLIFSNDQLQNVVNDSKALVTVEREGKTFLTRLPRVQVKDLRLSSREKGEIDDWRNEAKLSTKVDDLYFIPYQITVDGTVIDQYSYLDQNSAEVRHKTNSTSPLEIALLPNDRILAIDGAKVNSSYEIAERLQSRHIQIIVQRNQESPMISWKQADQEFDHNIDWNALQQLTTSIGVSDVQEINHLYRLKPIQPKPFHAFTLSGEKKERLEEYLHKQQEQIDAIEDEAQKAAEIAAFEKNKNMLLLGIGLQDRTVSYNPSPFYLFYNVVEETFRTMKGLFTGNLNPKWMSGPVGIVQVMHHGWTLGSQEALYWMGLISLNLGILNLMPIPVLDGGHICFALYEKFTKRRIKAKTMERMIIPFVVLLIGFLVFVTYQDIARIVTRFF